jgi:hypothetical protein
MVKFYVLRSKHTDKVYVGIAMKELKTRLIEHKSSYNGFIKGTRKYSVSSCELFKLGIDDVLIELLEDSNCEDKNLNAIRERYWMESFGDKSVNKHIPSKTIKEKTREYYLLHRDELIKLSKQYFTNNPEYRKEYTKKYNDKNRDWINQKIRERRALKKTTSLAEAVG